MEKVRVLFDPETVEAILKMKLSLMEEGEDELIWVLENSGDFFLKSVCGYGRSAKWLPSQKERES